MTSEGVSARSAWISDASRGRRQAGTSTSKGTRRTRATSGGSLSIPRHWRGTTDRNGSRQERRPTGTSPCRRTDHGLHSPLGRAERACGNSNWILSTQRLARFGVALTSGNAGEIDLDASPDGSKLAYRTTRAGRTEVWELDTNSRTERLLVASADWRPSTPRWSLDGRRLAYTRPQPGGTDAVVALLSPEAGDEQVVNLPEGAHLVPSDWSADGAAILSSCRLAPSDSMAVCLLTIQPEQQARVGANSRARRHQEPVGAAVLA